MRGLISQFADFPRPVQIAIMATSGLSISSIIYLALRGNWIVLGILGIGICIVVLMLLAYRALCKHLKKRKAKPFESEIIESKFIQVGLL